MRVVVEHVSDINPVKMIINTKPFVDDQSFEPLSARVRNYYNGGLTWTMNPRQVVKGSFPIKNEWLELQGRFGVEFKISVIDVYERHHKKLPFCYTYVMNSNSWNFEPTTYEELKKYFLEEK